jgi:uncharacterized membrane protein YidH (DUF202 family)
MLDLRFPAGLFFDAVGLILTVSGLMNPGNVAPLTPLNINLYAGVAMLVFGTFLLVLAKRSKA